MEGDLDDGIERDHFGKGIPRERLQQLEEGHSSPVGEPR